ncbi:hypothetical protein [Bdellovibrio sp. HCB2-146]|uniref:hypothetical protein n=1 Tax=Bdellovibrio sp. HCB2-146 TaxID=3394362 RepID=UPI0039BC6011
MQNLDQLQNSEYFSFQKNHTVGFFDSREDLDKALEALRSHGLSDDFFTIYHGAEGLHAIDPEGEEHSMLEKYARFIQKIFGSGDWTLLEEADREMRDGHYLLSVFTEDDEAKAEIIDILKEHHAHNIHYIGLIYIEEIS